MYSQVLAHCLGAYPKLPVALAENSGDSLAWTWTDATKDRCKKKKGGQHEQRLCTHALKVTGRYAVTSDVDAALSGCARGWDVALQNTTWRGVRDQVHGTQVLGFRVALTEDLFGWSQRGETCQECHVQSWLQRRPQARVCHLPPLSVRPVRGGSTGALVKVALFRAGGGHRV